MRPLAFGVVAILFMPGVTASGDLWPTPFVSPRFKTFDGYDWKDWVDATHHIVDVTAVHVLVDAANSMPALHLELTGLNPSQHYTLVFAGERREVYTDADGAGIAWNVPNEVSTWTLVHASTLEPVSWVTIDAAAPEPSVPMSACWWRCPARKQETRVTREDVTQTMVTEDLALVYTPDAVIKVEGETKRWMKVSAFVSGGAAAKAKAGGDYQQLRTLGQAYTSTGPAEYQRSYTFVKREYEDGSYMITAARGADAGSWVVTGREYGPGLATHTQSFPHEQIISDWKVWAYDQVDASLTFSGGVRAFGVGLDTSVQAGEGSRKKITIEIPRPAPGATYAWWWGPESGDMTGLVAAVWRTA